MPDPQLHPELRPTGTRRHTACCALCWNWTAKSSSAPTRIGPASRDREACRDRTWIQGVEAITRNHLDYMSMMCNEHAYCLAVEKAAAARGCRVHAQYIRTMFDEVTAC